ncbi:MAG: hypothetical protein LBM96_13230 [Methanobrevibacter sp.]|jgi:hypothetical protein|nr:hypothetical protein [Candidatus Methanoflexus mossambicus]
MTENKDLSILNKIQKIRKEIRREKVEPKSYNDYSKNNYFSLQELENIIYPKVEDVNIYLDYNFTNVNKTAYLIAIDLDNTKSSCKIEIPYNDISNIVTEKKTYITKYIGQITSLKKLLLMNMFLIIENKNNE